MLIESSTARQKEKARKRNWIIGGTVIVLLLVGIFLLIYFLAIVDDDDSGGSSQQGSLFNNTFYEERVILIPNNDSCYNFSLNMASEAHVAGEKQTLILANKFSDYLQSFGYDVYRDNISNIVLDHYIDSSLSINGEIIDISNEIIPGDKDTNTSFRHRAWNAFSASGNRTGQLLYVNNANIADFEYLQNDLGINFTENEYIALAKLGSRANAARNAALYGIKGLILFMNQYNDPDEQYPNSPGKLPDSGFMYGRTAYSAGCPGNPHPDRLQDQCGFNVSNYDDLYPALKNDISMITISSKNAINLFEIMNEYYDESLCDVLQDEQTWQTNLNLNSNISLCVGGTDDVMANLYTKNERKMDDTIQNVYGYFEGELYPDEIVMVGAHRDAWGLGMFCSK